MNEIKHAKLYQDATLALFSSLDIKKAIRSLHEVLSQVIPLESLVLHMVDKEKMTFHILADAVKRQSGKKRITKIPEHLQGELMLDNAESDTAHVFSGSHNNLLLSMLLKKYDYASESIYWAPLVLDKTHFGGFSALSKKGHDLTDQDIDILNSLRRPLTIALANATHHEEVQALRRELADDNSRLRRELNDLKGVDLVYETAGLSEVAKSVKRVAHRDTPVLILGETGSGKEVVANSVHNLSRRNKNPFITVNCGALPDNLADSYLFGHEKGAFTGADRQHKGFFERADKGTLFLDEIGELSLDVQVKLLRVLEAKTLERVGGQKSISVDVRLIAATHRDLIQMVNNDEFREDLWYRLNVFPIIVPPLRNRINDIPDLVRYITLKISKDLRLGYVPKIKESDLLTLQKYKFPGNVRELQNIIERALIYHDDSSAEYLSIEIDNTPESRIEINKPPSNDFPTLDDATRNHIQQSLKISNGRIQGPLGAAKLLDVHPSTLRAKIKKLKIRR